MVANLASSLSSSTPPDPRAAAPVAVATRGIVRSTASETLGTVIDVDVPLMSAGLDSLAAASFTTTLASRLSMELTPTALFDHPTLDSISSFLSVESSRDAPQTAAIKQQPCPGPPAKLPSAQRQALVGARAWSHQLAASLSSSSETRSVLRLGFVANALVPVSRWMTATAGPSSAAYGSFMGTVQLHFDKGCFGISTIEARSLDP